MESSESGGADLQKYLVYTKPHELTSVSKLITQLGYTMEEGILTKRPKMTQSIGDSETAKKVIEFTQRLEDMDDVQKVYPNFDIPEEILNSLG